MKTTERVRIVTLNTRPRNAHHCPEEHAGLEGLSQAVQEFERVSARTIALIHHYTRGTPLPPDPLYKESFEENHTDRLPSCITRKVINN